MKFLILIVLFCANGIYAKEKKNLCKELHQRIITIPIKFQENISLVNQTYADCLFKGIDEDKFQKMLQSQLKLKTSISDFQSKFSSNKALLKKCLKGKLHLIEEILTHKESELKQLSILPFFSCTKEGKNLLKSKEPLNQKTYKKYFEIFKKRVTQKK